ncbi:hypothetical protein EIN_155720 [Entamoeba invadens IP1]|uniref:Exportin-1/Importin-beta-like domain-containing protein n=1 Tax=Entamoeba invadens IP1 TaxID=370355 RepID=A0A0A1U944_ENTIV|nr:hypothetical protein EIN_155720 [Entamoeba invadens IP1]ELP91455.1 hypothetical protein EIN_155720 [Entamoeba invadens IP1]|eukprot:XP_004258226.1 hypothetical protein EIN_155720 [Entamoeba invadens IP1]
MEKVHEAVRVLYGGSVSESERRCADLYLRGLMNMPCVWELIPLLLAGNGMREEEILYGAISLERQVRNGVIPPSGDIYTFIEGCLSTHRCRNAVVAHLCRALSQVVVHSEGVRDVVVRLVGVYTQRDVPVSVGLNVLYSLGECVRRAVTVDDVKLRQYVDALRCVSETVLRYCVANSNVNVGVECLVVWVTNVGVHVSEIVGCGVDGVVAMSYSRCMSSGCDLLVSCVNCIEGEIESDVSFNCGLRILRHIMSEFRGVASRCTSEEMVNIVCDMTCCAGKIVALYCGRLEWIDVGSYFGVVSVLCQTKSECVSECVSRCIVEVVNGVSHRASSNVYDCFCEHVGESLYGVYNGYLNVQAVIPSGNDESETDRFCASRKGCVVEAVRCVSSVCGVERLLSGVESVLCSGCEWQRVEAAIFIFRCLVRVTESDAQCVLQVHRILLRVLSIVDGDAYLLHAAVACVGRHCDWMHCYAQDISVRALEYVMRFLCVTSLVDVACLSFMNICDACSVEFTPSFATIDRVFSAIYGNCVNQWRVGTNGYSQMIRGYILLLRRQNLSVQCAALRAYLLPAITKLGEATTPVECSVYAAVVNAWVLYGTVLEKRINVMEYSTAIVRVCDSVIVKAVSSGAPSAISAITSLLQDTLFFIGDNITTCYTEFVNRATSWWASSHISNFVSILYFTLRALRLATSMTFLSNSSINIVTIAQQFLIPVVEWIYSQDVDAVYDVVEIVTRILLFITDNCRAKLERTQLASLLPHWIVHFTATSYSSLYIAAINTLKTYLFMSPIREADTFLASNTGSLIATVVGNAAKFHICDPRDAAAGLVAFLFERNPSATAHTTTEAIIKTFPSIPHQLAERFNNIKLKANDIFTIFDDLFATIDEL